MFILPASILALVILAGIVVMVRTRATRAKPPPEPAATGLLHALVGPLGPAGTRSRDTGEWAMIVMVQGWRRPDGPVHRQPLRLQWPGLTRDAMDAHRADISAWSVVQLRADSLPPPLEPESSSIPTVVGSDISPVDDAQLQELARVLQQPVVVDDPMLGRFLLDRGLDRFEGETSWNGVAAVLTIPAEGEVLSAVRSTAAALWADPDTWDVRLRTCVVDHLLPLKNSTWRDEDDDGNLEPLLTADALVARLTVERVDIDQGGRFTFWFHDGGLFLGHTIAVDGSLEGGCTSAGIMG